MWVDALYRVGYVQFAANVCVGIVIPVDDIDYDRFPRFGFLQFNPAGITASYIPLLFVEDRTPLS
jgi:hypothetical protein